MSTTIMTFVNNYVPPPPKAPVTLPDPSKPYDINFCFPVKDLETERVKVTPFIPHLHANALFNAIVANPEVMRYMPFSTPATLEEFEIFCEATFRLDSGRCMFVILDKAKLAPGDETGAKVNDALMGTLSYTNASRELSTIEPGFIIILPQFQRTHVNTHAVGLLMQYALDKPSDGGLGLRRCQWQAHASNLPSARAAERLGFKSEGTLRWHRALPAERESSAPFRADDSLGLPGRHTAMLSICWDDWENGGKDHLQRLMDRKA
ncbi:GNAT family acetyltransferase, putative [Rhizoctonia solani AG-3 Rhs1AP]|uniref:GNAT family acetyltransferase, putative n=1 Tax=Rhizoctonia solani AG-3 Rhs1AP TaxID=1086054 RepID=X8JRU7_9AGAM|nr:GNAT family acetyltransferase, putative [Rhizoctonia solani AG-3 Rhs1AP]